MNGCRPLQKDEITMLMKNLDPRGKMLAMCGLYFGLRVSEMLTLKFKDLQNDYLNFLQSSKGSENATFPIPDEVKTALSDLKEFYQSKKIPITNETPLFIGRKNLETQTHITRQHAALIIRETCKKLGIDGRVNIHSFRKTFANKIYDLTKKDIRLTQKYTRHKNLNSLIYYLEASKPNDLVKELGWV